MNRKQEKAFISLKKRFDRHVGHIITRKNGERFVLAEAVLVNNTLRLKREGEVFADVYFDELLVKCSCGEEK